VPGQSALPLFVAVEEGFERALEEARGVAAARVEAAGAEAARIRMEGEERLRDVLLGAQEEARRTAEDHARDRVSEARVAVQRWVEAAETTSARVLEEALDLLARE
jgi:hypothetical protein